MYQKLTIIGRLTRDADVKDINGSTVANFSIAASAASGSNFSKMMLVAPKARNPVLKPIGAE